MATQDFSELNESALLIDFRGELTKLCTDYAKKGLPEDTIIMTLHNCEFIMLAKRQRDLSPSTLLGTSRTELRDGG